MYSKTAAALQLYKKFYKMCVVICSSIRKNYILRLLSIHFVYYICIPCVLQYTNNIQWSTL